MCLHMLSAWPRSCMFSGIFLLLDLIFQTLIIWTGSLHFELINIFKEPALPAMSVLDSKNPCSQFAAQTVKPVYLMKTCYVMKAFFSCLPRRFRLQPEIIYRPSPSQNVCMSETER